MMRALAKTVKYLIFLILGFTFTLLDPFFPSFADNPLPLSSSIISTRGEYDSFSPTGDIRRFNGETLIFDVDFIFFEKAATAKAQFYEYKGKYFATLVAETKGIVGFLTNYRKHYYKSTFDIVDQGRRVQTSKFERDVVNGDDKERTIHFLDYLSHTHYWFRFKNGELEKRRNDPISDEVVYDDVLAAFYNFRNGVYGDLKKGEAYKIDTLPEKSMKNIMAYINTDEEQEKFRIDEERAKSNELLLKVTIPKDVFKTDSGELIFWTSKHYIPLETTIKDYILLGDLHAKLRHGTPGKN